MGVKSWHNGPTLPLGLLTKPLNLASHPPINFFPDRSLHAHKHKYTHFHSSKIKFICIIVQESRRKELDELQQKLCSNETTGRLSEESSPERERAGEIRSKGTGGAQVRVCRH